MSSLSLDKNISPGEEVTIRIDMSLFGFGKTMEFTFTAPNAAPLLNKIDTIRLKSEAGKDKEKTKGNYAFSRYEKGESIDKNFYKLKLLLNSAKQANQLNPGETINLVTPSGGALGQLNSKNFQIIRDTNKNNKFIYLKVNKTYQPTGSSGAATGTLQEITGTVKTRKYTVTLPDKVFKGLVAQAKSPLSNGEVEDIPIFAFKRFTKDKSAEVKRKLMCSPSTEISDKEPPERSAIIQYRQVKSYSAEFDIDSEEKFIFYVALARYTYNKQKNIWQKEWIQTNASDEVLWGKAFEK